MASSKFEVFIIGEIKSATSFQYMDRRKNEKVKALKLVLLNEGKTTEVVLWPNYLSRIDSSVLQEGNLVAVSGKPRSSQWGISTSVSNFKLIYRK